MSNKFIATTRFNEDTFQQYISYKNKINTHQCIYGSPLRIKEHIPLESYIYVIEMNNSQNKIKGIGLIINKHHPDKYYRIYNDQDYNRYIYKGKKRLDISLVKDPYYQKVIEVLEQLLFKGERHCKRAQGITELPQWILKNKYEFDFIKCLNNLFNKYLK